MAQQVKNLPVNAEDARDVGSIPGLGIPFREGHGNPLQYSCLENPMDGGAWKTTENEMVGGHHRLDGHKFEQASGVGDEQGSLACSVHGVTKSWT